METMELCRLCHLKIYPNFHKNLFTDKRNDLEILDVIEILTGLKINESDPFPKVICCGCYERLVSFYRFRELVIKADQKYHEEFDIINKPFILKSSIDIVDVKGELNENDINSNDNDVHEDVADDAAADAHNDDSNSVEEPNLIEVQVKNVEKKKRITKSKPTLMKLLDDAKAKETANLPALCIIKTEDLTTTVENAENNQQSTITIEENVKKETLKIQDKDSDISKKCEECGLKTAQSHGLCRDCEKKKALSLLAEPTSTEDRTCSQCGKIFVSSNNLRRHLKNVHDGLKMYLCYVCGQSFTTNDTLQRHLKTHNGEKTHQCNYCGKCFLTKCYLNKHLKIHRTESLYACHICDRAFKQKSYLTTHLNVHFDKKRYNCMICSKRFSHKSNFNTHMRVHNGEKRFKCEYCGKRFLVKCNLKKHLEVHNK